MTNTKIKLGIFGFGCVGQGLYNVLQQTKGVNATIKKVCIKDPYKIRPTSEIIFTTDKNEILDDPEINVVVELTNDPEAAFLITKEALSRKKAVVSANKKMIAENLPELYQLQQEHKTAFLYEGACCASIPIIRNLEEYYDNDLLKGVEGIFNGTTNYILTKIFDENKSFEQALKEAQHNGFAESDPTSDLEAFDPKFKLCIILLHSFGVFIDPVNIFNYGISRLNDFDINYARQRDQRIKLVATCRKVDNDIYAYCIPQFVSTGNKLKDIHNEYNGVVIESAFAESQFFIGKGAGGNPTGSAVLSDISALSYNYRYEYKKFFQNGFAKLSDDVLLDVYVRYDTLVEIDPTDFERIQEFFQSDDYCYINGKINLQTLRNVSWLRNENVSIILN
jgi:homoserine dehydrogenase